jgi:hypothetical protein
MCVCAEGKAPPLPAVALREEVVEWVSKFKYLGTLVSFSKDILAEVQARVVKAINTFALLKPILLYKAIVWALKCYSIWHSFPLTLTYGCECWALKSTMASHLEAIHMSFMRSMLGSAY